MRIVAILGLAAVLGGAAAVSSAHGEPGAAEPLALLRGERASDLLPARFRLPSMAVVDSRLVASRRSEGRPVRLYLVQTANGSLCSLLVYRGSAAGMGCDLPSGFFGDEGGLAAISGRFFAGIVANEVSQLVIIGRQGDRHPVGFTADRGFIVGCRGPDGCACSVAWAETYDAAGVRISRDRWLAPRCWRRD